ncbi:hypothetical protein ACERK3_00230 [Phycisphaerales bacterium AB-hyl4]|uniref:Uncharacterized protein n=1 Tax=Natronomicrosphaera hydrolytica TaxID=3242702 RepID=A0ABV4U024_9BACT
MDILIEQDVRLDGPFWDRRGRTPYNIVQSSARPWGLVGGMILCLFLLTFVTGEDLFLVSLLFSVLAVVSLLAAYRKRRRSLRRLVARCGSRLLMFVHFTDEQVELGARDHFVVSYAWQVLIDARINNRLLEMNLGGDQIIVDLSSLSDGQLAELQRHIGVVLGDGMDTCPKCRYDLRGSTGDTCPECGTVVRHAAAAETTTLR